MYISMVSVYCALTTVLKVQDDIGLALMQFMVIHDMRSVNVHALSLHTRTGNFKGGLNGMSTKDEMF